MTTKLTKVNIMKHIGEGIYKKDLTEYNKILVEDRKNTVEKNPNKKWALDPFVGYVEVKEK